MSDIENGKRNVSLDILSRIADFRTYHVHAEALTISYIITFLR